MRIGLISDTHIPSVDKVLPPQVTRAFQGVDLILHAGDVFTSSCLEELGRIAPVKTTASGAAGMGEGAGRVSAPLVFEAEGHSLGLIHMLWLPGLNDDIVPGTLARDFPPKSSLPAAVQNIFGKAVDIVVFGHTHIALVETHQGVLFVNPGSTDLVGQVRKRGTVAILEITPQSREARIVELAKLAG